MTSVGADMAANVTKLNSIIAWDKKEQEEEDKNTDFYAGA
jgi:hypothetical protein